MTEGINLNPNVSIKTLYADANLSDEQITQIEQAAVDGFTEDELQQLESDGIDTSLIKDNAQKPAGEKTSVADKANEIKAKYLTADLQGSGDAYSMKNPEMQAFKKALDDGIMAQLGELGYSKTEMVDIISQAFPSIGIKNKENGKYDCPYGHGQDAKDVYNKFVEDLTKASNVDGTALAEAQKQLAKINTEILNNNTQLKNLDYNITMLQNRIQSKIDDAIEDSKEIVEDQKAEAKKAVSENLEKYTDSKGEMTYEEFQKSLASDLDAVSSDGNRALSRAVLKIVNAQREMSTLSGYLTKMDGLVKSNASLSEQAKEFQSKITEIKDNPEVCEPGSDEDCNRCDPIGFTNADGVRFDFFVDKDADGNVTNENEFLGAEDGWKEMIGNDANNDGYITAEELDAKNVKVVVTNADGSQEIKNASEVLGKDGVIDLDSYKSQNEELANGNALLGTFNVHIGDQTLSGYQTLDTLGWLDDNFEFSDEINGVGRHMRSEGEVAQADDYSQKYNIFAQQYTELQGKLKEVAANLGIDAAEIGDKMTDKLKKEAKAKADQIQEALDKTEVKAQKAEEAQEAEAAEAAEAADAAQGAEATDAAQGTEAADAAQGTEAADTAQETEAAEEVNNEANPEQDINPDEIIEDI